MSTHDSQVTENTAPAANSEISSYERIKQAILDGTFPPGAALVESSLGEWCNVSRTPIREALGRLEQDGLVVRTERGMTVRERTPEEIIDIYEVRIYLEGAASKIAAERRTQMDIIRLEREYRLDEESPAGEGDILAERNRSFHRAVWLASHNEAIIDLLDRVNLHLLRYPVTTLTAPGRRAQALEQHRTLLDAIIDRDSELAQKTAQEHIEIARDIRLSLWVDDV